MSINTCQGFIQTCARGANKNFRILGDGASFDYVFFQNLKGTLKIQGGAEYPLAPQMKPCMHSLSLLYLHFWSIYFLSCWIVLLILNKSCMGVSVTELQL